MLARRPLARLASQPSPLGAAPKSARNMATLREIELRLKSVRNIEKITKVSRHFVFMSFVRLDHGCLLFYVVHENDCFH
jgi:hypothetical protein